MVYNNATNTNVTGIVTLSSSGAATGSTVTQHGVVIGGASNAVTSTGVGATNTVLLGSTGADPSFGTVPNAALTNSSVTINTAGTITGGGAVALGASLSLTGTGSGGAPLLTFIGSATASTSASLKFTSLSSTYRGYRYYLVAVLPASSSLLSITASTDNGSTFITSASYYSPSQSLTGATWNSISGIRTEYRLTDAATTVKMDGIVDIYFNNGANNLLTFQSSCNVGNLNIQTLGFLETQSNVNAIQFIQTTGNITSGTIYQFGIS